jgi:multidrug efflux system membrane fusion protein
MLESSAIEVDPKTGTVRWRAVFSNTDGLLIPGMFARVRVAISPPYRAMLVASHVIGSDEEQKFLFVVTEKGVVEHRSVKLGTTQGGLRVVTEGLTAGEWVLVRGLARVKQGMTIQPEKIAMPTKD